MRTEKFKESKMLKKLLTCLALCVFVCMSITEHAYAYIPLGVTGYGLYGNYETQEKSNWCWVACAKNINYWTGTSFRTQSLAVMEVKGSVSNVTGNIYETQQAAEYISNHSVSYTWSNNVLSYFGICDRIFNDQPVIAGGLKFLPTGFAPHMVLFVAWYNGNGNNRLTFFDPETGFYEDCIYEDLLESYSPSGFMYWESVYMI